LKRRIDHDRVVTGLRAGLSEAQVAERLDCSVRMIYRIAEMHGIHPSRELARITPQEERRVWAECVASTNNISRVAYTYCVSRTAVCNALRKGE
jgi:hypothetical protein